MKKIILDAASNAYLFDGTHAESMGKAETIKDLWFEDVFAIGKDIYLKKDDEYSLLATDAKFLPLALAILLLKSSLQLSMANVCM